MARSDRAQKVTRIAAVIAACAVIASATGCRVNEDDIHRWETTAHGPDKLVAVLKFDKYDTPLRVEAAMSLIRMKPRQGRRVSVQQMVETLASPQVQPEARQAIVASLVPLIIAELKKPPPVAQAGQPLPPDGSFPFKDAAYAMLNQGGVIADENLKQQLRTALTEWAMADFEHRLDNRAQMFGMEQLLRLIGPSSVASLPKLMTRDARRLDQMSSIVSEIGDAKAKEAAANALVAIASFVISDDWTKLKTPELKAANDAGKLKPTDAQFKMQLNQYQDEELFRVFVNMKKVGGRPVIDFLLGFAADKKNPEKRRQASLAALEGRIDRSASKDIKIVLGIASSDAPDVVVDQAFRRLGELPRDKVVDKLYDLFKTDKWKVRKAAAVTVIRMSTSKNIDEFMEHLPEGREAKGFGMGEALAYGALLGDFKDKPIKALAKHMASGGFAARTSALSYYLEHGTSGDLKKLERYEYDKTSIPACETDPDCKWVCYVPKEGSPEPEAKDIKTVGEFVKSCIVPNVKDKKPEKKP